MEHLLWEKKNSIGILKFHRPEALNAINTQMIDECMAWLAGVKQDKTLRALILTGSGEKAFIAGADIKEMNGFSTEQAKRFSEKGHLLLMELQNLKMPVISAVNGFALGGGCEMAMAADFIIASDTAVFGLPEVTLGLIPGFGGTQRLPKFVGMARAAEMIFTGRKYSAAEAQQFGLVNTVTTPAELLNKTIKIATDIASRGPLAVAAAKRTIFEGYHLPLRDGLEVELEFFSQLFATQDLREGTKAFVEKRLPQFKGE